VAIPQLILIYADVQREFRYMPVQFLTVVHWILLHIYYIQGVIFRNVTHLISLTFSYQKEWNAMSGNAENNVELCNRPSQLWCQACWVMDSDSTSYNNLIDFSHHLNATSML
jgi:hypothetical protein